VLGIRADDEYLASPTDYLAIGADFLDGRFYFHIAFENDRIHPTDYCRNR
jgi:hypothetical protein